MDAQQSQKINEAAQKFADALIGSYRVASNRAVATQELNTELTQNFFKAVLDNLHAQTESNREMVQEVIAQQERQREAAHTLAQESAGAYMRLMDQMFSYYHLLVASRSKRV